MVHPSQDVTTFIAIPAASKLIDLMLLKTTIPTFLLLVSIICIVPSSTFAQVRIVCIGNSITQGKIGLKSDSSYEYSYRPWLWEKLISNGFKVDMVGFHPYFFDEQEGRLSMHFKAGGLSFDRDCEAYYGITSAQFLNGSESTGWTGAPLPAFAERINSAKRGYTPDIALIHIGTNDKDSTMEQVAATRSNIGAIIRVLRAKNPAVVVLVAKLITGWKKINGQIDALCQEWHTTASPVVPVDMTTGFINDPKLEGTMTYDYVHPNRVGQVFMMERWYKAIMQNLPDTVPPQLSGKITVTHQSRTSVMLSWPAAHDNYGIMAYEVLVNGKLVATTNYNKQAYTLTGLRQGRSYKVQVRVKDWSGKTSTKVVATVVNLK